MNMVYHLTMIDLEASYGSHIEAFNIGVFSSREIAEKTAKRYLNEVRGFKDYNVTHQITEKCVIGSNDASIFSELYIIYGWNENEELDEIDIIESDSYVIKEEAEQKLNELKASCCRENWCIDKYIIDECNWQEGYVKE